MTLPSLDLPLIHLYQPADRAAGPAWLLVLLHGVGSNDEDLFSLAPHVPPRFNVLSLRAPNTLGAGSYAWFTFDVHPDGRRVINRAQEAASRPLVVLAVQEAADQLDVPAERVVVGGFSQGGIMALSVLLTSPELVRAAMVMHSRLLPEVVPLISPTDALRGRSLWVSHGTADTVIPIVNARDIRARAVDWPLDLSYHEYPGGHEIRPAELGGAMSWLDDLNGPGGLDGR